MKASLQNEFLETNLQIIEPSVQSCSGNACCFRRRGNCKKASVGLQCEVGLRCRTYYVLCGSVLSVWNELEEVLTPVSGTNVKVQIVRLRTEDGQRIVGESTVKLRASERDEGVNSRLSRCARRGRYSPVIEALLDLVDSFYLHCRETNIIKTDTFFSHCGTRHKRHSKWGGEECAGLFCDSSP